MKVSQFLRRSPECVSGEATCIEAAQRMRAGDVGSLVVVDGERPIGMLTDRDLVVRVIARGAAPGSVRVSQVMSDKPAFIEETREVAVALDMMRDMSVRRIPVVDEQQRCVGVIALDDIIGALAFELGSVAETLRAARPPGLR